MAGPPADAADAREERREQLKVAMVARDREDIEPLRVAVEAGREVGLGPEDLEPAEELLRKLEANAAPLTFADMPLEDMERLQAAATREQAIAILMQCFNLSVDDGFQAQILAEFHYHNFAFCQRQGFRLEKTSTFLSIMKKVHSQGVLTEKLTEWQARELFEGLLTRHSQQLPPYRVGAFSREEAALLREYASRSFFRLYSLHVFACERREDLALELRDLPVVPRVPPLARLHESFETDPAQAARPAPPAAAAAAATSATIGGKRRQESSKGAAVEDTPVMPSEPEVPAKGPEAAVAKAIDDALQARLGALDARMKLPS